MSTWAHLLVLAAALAANAFVQVIFCRLSARQGAWLISLAAGLGAGLVVLLAAGVACSAAGAPAVAGSFAARLAVGLAYLGYSFFYANVVNGGRTALRVRMLAELREHPAGLTVEEIVARYRPEEMFDTRLERLLRHGQIVLRDGRVHLARRPLAVLARVVAAAQTLVLGRQGVSRP